MVWDFSLEWHTEKILVYEIITFCNFVHSAATVTHTDFAPSKNFISIFTEIPGRQL